ncbi:MAG TPA: hypothetical protein VF507_00785 [Pyrinomonadaceae bacterium]|jgi:hypothetical protein
MHQEIKRLLAALCTFALGLVAVMFWIEYRRPVVENLEAPPCFQPPHYESTTVPCSGLNFSALGDIPNLSYCELVNAADVYDNKIVRVRARLFSFIHGTIIYDGNCPSTREKDTDAAISFHPTTAEEVRRALTDASGSKYYGFEPLDLIVVGRLKKVTPSNESDTVWDTASLRFEIMRVEKASKVH